MEDTNESVILKVLHSTVESVKASLEDVPGESAEGSVEGVFAEKISGDAHTTDDNDLAFRVPKYFQAIITLFVSFFLLAFTLVIISQTRRLCQKSSCSKPIPMGKASTRRRRDERDSPSDIECVVTDEDGHVQRPNIDLRRHVEHTVGGEQVGDRHFDYYSKNSPTSQNKGADESNDPQSTAEHQNKGNQSQSTTNNSSQSHSDEMTKEEKDLLLKLKKVRFVRRVSGPFGEDAIDFVGQTYKAKYMEAQVPKKTGEVFHKKQSIKKPPSSSPTPPPPHASPSPKH